MDDRKNAPGLGFAAGAGAESHEATSQHRHAGPGVERAIRNMAAFGNGGPP